MDEGLSKRPKGVEFNELSESVFAILEQYTAFPWAIMAAQAKRIGATAHALAPGDLKKLVEPLANGVGRYTSPEKQEAVKDALTSLARRVGAG
jgi:hypothetical protein